MCVVDSKLVKENFFRTFLLIKHTEEVWPENPETPCIRSYWQCT